MANQRIFLKCTCGDTFQVGKRMGVGYYVPPQFDDFKVSLNEFYDNHEQCSGWPDCFALEYEIEQEHYYPEPAPDKQDP